MRQHLVEGGQLIYLVETSPFATTAADAEHLHAEVLAGVGDVLAYAAGAEQQQGLASQPLIGVALPQLLLLLITIER